MSSSNSKFGCFEQPLEFPTPVSYLVPVPDVLFDDPIAALRSTLLSREPLNLDPASVESANADSSLPSFADLGTSPSSAFGIDRIDAAILSHGDAAAVAYASVVNDDPTTDALLGGRSADSDPRPTSDPDSALSPNSEDSPTLQTSAQ